jgi:hypothetical protein
LSIIIVRNQDLILSYQEIDCEKMFLKVLALVFSSNFFEIFTQKINVSSIATLAVHPFISFLALGHWKHVSTFFSRSQVNLISFEEERGRLRPPFRRVSIVF